MLENCLSSRGYPPTPTTPPGGLFFIIMLRTPLGSWSRVLFVIFSLFRWQQQRVVAVMSAHITVGWLIPDEMPSESGSWDRVISNLFFFTKSRTTWRRKEDGNKKEQSSVTSGFPHHPDVVPLGWIKKRAVKRMKNTPSRFQGYIHETSLRK